MQIAYPFFLLLSHRGVLERQRILMWQVIFIEN